MKITKRQLRRIIREEAARLNEARPQYKPEELAPLGTVASGPEAIYPVMQYFMGRSAPEPGSAPDEFIFELPTGALAGGDGKERLLVKVLRVYDEKTGGPVDLTDPEEPKLLSYDPNDPRIPEEMK